RRANLPLLIEAEVRLTSTLGDQTAGRRVKGRSRKEVWRFAGTWTKEDSACLLEKAAFAGPESDWSLGCQSTLLVDRARKAHRKNLRSQSRAV
ncbi:hypothetical protein HHI36_005461, partial [Cryptolaemus montrouzieri]